jgi:hypothetical protein
MNFLEQVKADFIANGVRMAQQMNQTAEQRFLDAARDWARNGGTSGEPRPDEAVQAVFSFDDFFTMKIAGTGRPVSSIDPKSFLPSYGTDEASIGGPVGGPIPNQPGRFYTTSTSSPWLGQQIKLGERRFVFTATSPFNKYWEEIGGRETPGK